MLEKMDEYAEESSDNKVFIAYANHYDGSNTSLIFNRYIWVVDNFLPGYKGYNILEIGCGDGGVIQFLKDSNEVIGMDASKSGVEICKNKGITANLFDASRDTIPFENDYFDIIICLETLEHVENPQHCLEEIKRCLKSSGSLIISIPNPKTRHEFIYPCLFEYKNFIKYLKINFQMRKFKAWGYIPFFRDFKTKSLNNFYLNHGIQYILRKLFGHKLTYFWAWCWVFEATKLTNNSDILEKIARNTKYR